MGLRIGPRARALLLCAALAPLVAGSTGESSAERLTRAGAQLLASLDAEQRADLAYAFTDDERFDLRLAPILLEGLKLRDMTEQQRAQTRALLAAGLSPQGLAKVETIMSLEGEVERLDREGWMPAWISRRFRDPLRYYLALFGEPEAGATWGFRFDGHHLSLNYTVAPGEVPSATPLFLGGQPREVPAGWERAGLRVLADEEDAARGLYLALADELRARATLPFRSDRGHFLGGGRSVRLEGPPAGLGRAAMTPAQQAALDALIDVYLANFTREIADARREGLDAAGRDTIHFAWSGSDVPGEPCYYRVTGPTFLIEFDNSEARADHIHAVWRDFVGDFGMDLLADHYQREH